jgi:hypothetical protein
METWIVTDSCGEYVEYYNPTGHVMVFTRDREKARVTTCSQDAYEVARVAQRLYGRKQMRMGMAS